MLLGPGDEVPEAFLYLCAPLDEEGSAEVEDGLTSLNWGTSCFGCCFID